MKVALRRARDDRFLGFDPDYGICALLLGVCLWSSGPLLAQEDPEPSPAVAGVSGRAANLMPLRAAALYIKAQTVELTFVPDKHAFDVSVRSELASTGQAAVGAQLGIPEFSCEAESEFEDHCDPARNAFSHIDVSVRDKPLTLRKQRVPPDPSATDAPTSAWLLPLRIQPGENVSVQQHYTVPAGEANEGGWSASYLLRGVSAWSKPIGRATFKISFPARSCLVVEPEQLPRKSRRVVPHGDEPWLELVYEAYGFMPARDFALYFEPCVVARDTEMPSCPVSADLARFFYPPQDDAEGEPIDESKVRADLAHLSDTELTRCRDGVFETYAGYFAPAELKKLPTHRESDRHYTAPLLTEADWKWVHYLDHAVAERDACGARSRAARSGSRGASSQAPRYVLLPKRRRAIERRLAARLDCTAGARDRVRPAQRHKSLQPFEQQRLIPLQESSLPQWQLPDVQRSLSEPHFSPQLPQLSVSLDRSLQLLLQQLCPDAHA
jgi:hypothetical protein